MMNIDTCMAKQWSKYPLSSIQDEFVTNVTFYQQRDGIDETPQIYTLQPNKDLLPVFELVFGMYYYICYTQYMKQFI